jgi:Cys-tRNA(Pro)/Cys-tRNA(Cys) deacylase
MSGTPATSALIAAGIAFTEHAYTHEPGAVSFGLEAAEALAGAVGGKRAAMADPATAERRTGYVVGGISPIGQKTAHPTVLDESAELWDTVVVSGGRRGLDLELAPADLVSVTGATLAAIAVG